jgi:hypothetical protein
MQLFWRRGGEIQHLKSDDAASPIFHRDHLITGLLSDLLGLWVAEPDG